MNIEIPAPVLTVEVEEECSERTSWELHFLVTVRVLAGSIVWQRWDTEAFSERDALDRASEVLAEKFRKILQ